MLGATTTSSSTSTVYANPAHIHGGFCFLLLHSCLLLVMDVIIIMYVEMMADTVCSLEESISSYCMKSL